MKVGVSNKVGVPCRVAFLNNPRDGSSPSVVTPRVKESLIDSPANKAVLKVLLLFFGAFVNIEHLRKGVSMVLQPKLVLPLNVFVRSVKVRVRLRVVDDFVLIFIHGPRLRLDLSRKPVMPALESIVRS